jgi:DNA-binding CsgD family transcriptional regulator
MAKSGSIPTSCLRAVFRLVGECRELGDDADLWWRHFLAEVAKVVDAGFGIGAEISGCLQAPRCDLGTTIWGCENGFDQAGWFRMLQTFHDDPLYNPLMNEYIVRMPAAIGACLGRTDMIRDQDWYPSHYYQALHRTLGADATLVCFQPVSGAADTYTELYLARATGQRDFSGRDRAIVREAFAVLAPLVGGPLARFSDPAPNELAPRVRQVLRCLLEGDSDKQIASRLNLAPFTVNQYTKVIHRHFAVKSRAELLARWIRRGWGNKCAWAD